jgi:hypothetical protein
VAPVVSSGLENSKKGENRYLAQEAKVMTATVRTISFIGIGGYASRSITPVLNA